MENSNSRTQKVVKGAAIAALIGALLSTYIAPKVIAWYFDPPVDIGVNCRPAVEWSMSKLQLTQFCGLAAGFLIGLTLMILITKTTPKSN
jgi:hypothetical protein